MSTESVDPDLVEETKAQIRSLVREIAQLSKSEASPIEFYDGLLNRIVTALAAIGGAIWTVGEGGGLELEYQINLRETRLGDSEEDQHRHYRLLRKVLKSGQGMLAQPHSGGGDEDDGGNPTDYLLVLGPLKTDQRTSGIVEVIQRPGTNIKVQQGYLRFVLQMCDLAGEYLKTRQLRHFTDRQVMWSQLENFTRITHRSLDPRLTAYTIANEGRRLIECDRVSVGIVKGRKCRIEAVSGQDVFDKRSNTVTLLAQLATAVTATGEAIWYTGDTSFMAPQVEEAIQGYVDEAHSKAVGVIPLKRPQEATDENQEAPEVIGALIVEQIEDSKPKEGLMQRVEVVAEHSSIALANAIEHQGLFLMPVWKAIGRAKWIVQARTLPKTIAISVAVLAVLLWACLWPAKFELEGKGALWPVERRDVFVLVDGRIRSIEKLDGDDCKSDEILVKMESPDLEFRATQILGNLRTTQARIDSNKSKLQQTTKSPAEAASIEGDIDADLATIRSLENQLELLNIQQERLDIRSPIDGKLVVDWDVREKLLGRPVQKGQILMAVHRIDGDWELEIHVAEDRMGFIAEAQQKLKKDLDVTYILATDPGRKLKGKVKEVQPIAEVRGEEGNTVLIKVAINRADVEKFLRPGAGVTAKLDCGTASIGYVWLHDLVAFVQTKILFRL